MLPVSVLLTILAVLSASASAHPYSFVASSTAVAGAEVPAAAGVSHAHTTVAPGSGRKTHPVTVQDLVNLDRISDPVVSPCGTFAVFSRTSYHESLDKTSTALFKVNLADGVVTPLTSAGPGVSDSSPVFVTRKQVAFLSSRSGSSQIWSLKLDDPEASLEQLSSYPVDLETLRFVKPAKGNKYDGKGLFVFSARVYREEQDPLKGTAERDKRAAAKKSTGKVYSELYFRHWDTFSDKKVSHIFTAPLKDLNDVVDVMYNEAHESPVLPFGGVEQYDVSPDGTEIAFTAQKPGVDLAWTTNLNIYTVPARGGSKPVSISDFNPAQDSTPVYSPDGRFIAYLAMSVPQYEADQYRVTLFDRQTSTTTYLTGKAWDRSASSITWSEDSKNLYLTAPDAARDRIFQLEMPSDLPDEEQLDLDLVPKLILAEGTSSRPVLVQDCEDDKKTKKSSPRLVFSRSTLSSPPDLFVLDVKSQGLEQITSVNAEKLASAVVPTASEYFFAGANGDKVQAWILTPPNFDDKKKYPVAFLIHGGPESAWLDNWGFRWNPAVFAAQGYVVITVNPHGSTGFGQNFTDAINENWGGAPFEDLIKGLDHAGKVFPFVDLDRVCALGASYGGYMINWINGHNGNGVTGQLGDKKRFRCLVNHDGLFSTVSMGYSSEELFFTEKEFGGKPSDSRSREIYEKWNPERFVAQWQTPTLVIHGGKDYRVPETEGLSTFTALRRKGVEAKLLYFPDENHWVLRRPNLVQWYSEIFDWLGKHLKNNQHDEL